MSLNPATRDEVIQRLLAVSDAKITPSQIQSTTSLRQDLDINSMTLIALAADLEDELGIRIEDEVLARIQTIGDLFTAIENTQPRNRPT